MLFSDNKYARFFELVAGINIKTRKTIDKEIKRFGITFTQMGALIALANHKGVSQKELAALLETDVTTAMVVCDSLEKKRMLVRERDQGDRRMNRLFLTTAGMKKLKPVMAALARFYRPYFELLEKNNVEAMLPALENIYESIKEKSDSPA